MAISRLSLTSALCLAVSLLIAPVAAQASLGVAPTKCITITTTTAGPCPTARVCPQVFCPDYIMLETQPCGCPFPAETSVVEVPCGCPGCPPNTWVEAPVGCPGKSCPTVTASRYPACPQVTGCVTPDCIVRSSIGLGCDCTGLQTVTSCSNGCPTGCATEYVGLPAPCPMTSIAPN